jgi:hypothetical protein
MHHHAPLRLTPVQAHATRVRDDAFGEVLAEKRLLTELHSASAAHSHASPHRPVPYTDREQSAVDNELGLVLDAIAANVHKTASAARDGIIAEFAARVSYARRHLPRHQLAAALSGIAKARKAALALIKRNEAFELSARRAAALAASRRSRPLLKKMPLQSVPSP